MKTKKINDRKMMPFVRNIRKLQQPLSRVRMMSGHGSLEQAQAETKRCLTFTIIMTGLSSAVGVYNYVTLEHDHQEKTGLTYQKIRNKPFPWKECPNCDLFDMVR